MLQPPFSESNAPVRGMGSLRPSIQTLEATPHKSRLAEKLKELARSIPVVAAVILAATAGVLKIYDPSLLTEWLRRDEDQVFEALVLVLIALVRRCSHGQDDSRALPAMQCNRRQSD
jgi:hypothetical protein